MRSQLATVVFLVLASSSATKNSHPFHHFNQDNEVYGESVEDLDDDSKGLLAKMAARLRAQEEKEAWVSPPGPPNYYYVTDIGPADSTQEGYSDDFRTKRKGPSLSIVNPLEVLQEKWLLEMSRKQKARSWEKLQRNREILSSIGKRSDRHSNGAQRRQTFPRDFEIVYPPSYQT